MDNDLLLIGDLAISTTCLCPPIPVRSRDWCAVDDNTYDGSEDSHSPIGYGATREEAIADLLEQISFQGETHAN